MTGIVENGRASSRFQTLLAVRDESAVLILVGTRQRSGRPHRRRVGTLADHGGRVAGARLEEDAELRVAAAALEIAQRRHRYRAAPFVVVRRQLLEQH